MKGAGYGVGGRVGRKRMKGAGYGVGSRVGAGMELVVG